MNRMQQPRSDLAGRLFTLGSASLFIGLMGAVAWALTVSNVLLK